MHFEVSGVTIVSNCRIYTDKPIHIQHIPLGITKKTFAGSFNRLFTSHFFYLGAIIY